MSAAPAIAEPRVDPLDAFIERAAARALLWVAGEYDDLPAAVDQLQIDAERDGLVERIGQDRVQWIISAAFEPYRREAADA